LGDGQALAADETALGELGGLPPLARRRSRNEKPVLYRPGGGFISARKKALVAAGSNAEGNQRNNRQEMNDAAHLQRSQPERRIGKGKQHRARE
jgi:hypothetical protein